MYIPRHFAVEDQRAIRKLVDENDFAVLVCLSESGELIVNHLPLIFENDQLIGHVASGNPICESIRAGLSCTAIFQGPHGYISPRFYPSGFSVPTWNYAVIHIHGRFVSLSGDDGIDALKALTRRYEDITQPPFSDFWDDANYWRRAIGTMAFRIEITNVDAKFKLGQNRLHEDRIGAIHGLKTSDRESDRMLAKLMTDALESHPSVQ